MERVGKRMRSAWTMVCVVAVIAIACVTMTGCGSSNEGAQNPSQNAKLDGQQLNVYCGAGMTEPFQEIADLFSEETGCAMNVTYANAAQIQTQINTTGEGDFFIAGSKEELKPVEGTIASSEDLVRHIPVLAVPSSNPAGITSVAGLAHANRVLIGDPESTPIGKIAKKALSDAGIWDSLMGSGAITTTTTAPQIATALAAGEGDAGIVWKENVKGDGVTIVDTPDLDALVKVIPAAQLTSAQDIAAVDAFEEFLKTDAVWDIWASYGYERA